MDDRIAASAAHDDHSDRFARPVEHVSVLIVGAGLSGINAAYRLQTECPDRGYAILEARGALGGTWDLFRYPGIRSDSDMHTLGYPFRPWIGETSTAEGAEILRYLAETADTFGIADRIRFDHRVVGADWSSTEERWAVTCETPAGRSVVQCDFLCLCTGYYDMESGYQPDLPERSAYRGAFIHPQNWPAGLDVSDKQIVVIGSGATAVTLVPALAQTASHVTMLQRSPSYVVARPNRDPFAAWALRHLPARTAMQLTRWKSIVTGLAGYWASRRWPVVVKRALLRAVRAELPGDPTAERHFDPRYDPWDQRVCLAPDGDLFAAIRSGRASVVTDEIAGFTADGVRLASGEVLPADIVVSATELKMKLMGGICLSLDGAPVEISDRMVYRGFMIGGLPNLAFTFGYINASWTLRSDLVARQVCRLLNRMRRLGATSCRPTPPADDAVRLPLLDFSSGYVRRALDSMPKRGVRMPWRVDQNYILDMLRFMFARENDGVLEFRRRGGRR